MKKLWLFVIVLASACVAQDGAGVYKQRCAMCHDSPKGRTPSVDSLHAMSEASILRALETGAMREQASSLNTQERHAVATYLSGGTKAAATQPLPASAYCHSSTATATAVMPSSDWNGFGAAITNTRFQNKEAAGLGASDVTKLRLRWAFGLGDVTGARGQPVIVGSRLFAATTAGKLYSLDAKNGCVFWSFDADAAIRSGVVVGNAPEHSGKPIVFFGDRQANVYAVDAKTGNLIWKTHVEDHPASTITDTPNLSGGVLYIGVSSIEEFSSMKPEYVCCSFRGSVIALDAATGKTVWKTYTVAQPAVEHPSPSGQKRMGPSGAGVWSTPTVDLKRNALYVATGDNYSDPATDTSDAVLALDLKSGKILWSRQVTANDAYTMGCAFTQKTNCPDTSGPDFDFGQPPILASLANDKSVLVIGQKSGIAYGLDPDQQGKLLWQTRIGKGGTLGGIQWGSAADQKHMYVALSDIRFKQVFDPKNPTVMKLDPDPNQGGGLFALDLLSGEKVWSAPPPSCGDREHCSPAQAAAVSAISGVVFSGSMDGHMRAYSTETGAILWDYDTIRDYDGINGQKAHGGAIDASGPAIAGGMLYVYSGYGHWGGVPGNALLAFSVDGK